MGTYGDNVTALIKMTDNKLIRLYNRVITLLTKTQFDLDLGTELAKELDARSTVKDIASGVTLSCLRIAHVENHGKVADIPGLRWLASRAFTELATCLRDPKARKIVSTLIKMCGGDEQLELFGHVLKIRPFDRKKGMLGPVHVSFVIQSGHSFLQWFRNPGDTKIGRVYPSFAPYWSGDPDFGTPKR